MLLSPTAYCVFSHVYVSNPLVRVPCVCVCARVCEHVRGELFIKLINYGYVCSTEPATRLTKQQQPPSSTTAARRLLLTRSPTYSASSPARSLIHLLSLSFNTHLYLLFLSASLVPPSTRSFSASFILNMAAY